MKLTPLRRRFLLDLIAFGPFSYAPNGVHFPSDAVLAQMEKAGWIKTRPVGAATHHVARREVTRRVEFSITDSARAMMREEALCSS